MYKKFIFTFTLLFFTFSSTLLFSMEQDGFSQEYWNIASQLADLYNSNFVRYLSEYENLRIKLSGLSPEEQINAISSMLDVVGCNKALTKGMCWFVKNLCLKKINEDATHESLKALIMDKIVKHPAAGDVFNQRIFERLKNLCSPGTLSVKEKEKEKEKEVDPAMPDVLDKENSYFAEQIKRNIDFFGFGDSGIAQDVLRGLFSEHYSHKTLEDQYALLLQTVNQFTHEPFIKGELETFAGEFKKLLGTQRIQSINNDNDFGTEIRLERVDVDYWGNPGENTPTEILLKKAARDYLLNNPHTILDRINSRLVGKPALLGSFICLAFNNGMVHLYDVRTNTLLEKYKTHIKNPSFFTDHEYELSEFACEPIQVSSMPELQTIFLYGNTRANSGNVDFEYPHCVSSYKDGSLEVDTLDKKTSYSIPNKSPLTTFLIKNNNVYYALQDSTLRVWDLINKRCKKIITCMSPVKSIAIPEKNGILFLIENFLLGAELNREQVFEMPVNVNAQDAESLLARHDGFAFGMRNGMLVFIKADKELHAPREIDAHVTGPITGLHSFEDIIVVQTPEECNVLHFPFSN